jgi:ankyrin repeat protein
LYSRNGHTTLRLAVESGNLEIVSALIAGGAKIDTKIKGGKFAGLTPLDLSVRTEELEIVDLLQKEKDAKINVLNKEGLNLVHNDVQNKDLKRRDLAVNEQEIEEKVILTRFMKEGKVSFPLLLYFLCPLEAEAILLPIKAQ